MNIIDECMPACIYIYIFMYIVLFFTDMDMKRVRMNVRACVYERTTIFVFPLISSASKNFRRRSSSSVGLLENY